jgi:hypothetical protein
VLVALMVGSGAAGAGLALVAVGRVHVALAV